MPESPCAPCPVCGDPYGFHLDEPHDSIQLALPKRPSANELRRQQQAGRAAEWAAYRAENHLPTTEKESADAH